MNLLAKLKVETRELHEKIENSLPLMRPGFRLSEYRHLITRFYGFYRPLESEFYCLAGLDEALPDWRQRLKTEWLRTDLLALGCTGGEIEQLPQSRNLPGAKQIPEALGCFYVMEGSTLGGQIISRHLQATLSLGPERGGAFFYGYGQQAGAKWKAFQAALPVAVAIGEHERTVASARQTFRCLQEWLTSSD